MKFTFSILALALLSYHNASAGSLRGNKVGNRDLFGSLPGLGVSPTLANNIGRDAGEFFTDFGDVAKNEVNNIGAAHEFVAGAIVDSVKGDIVSPINEWGNKRVDNTEKTIGDFGDSVRDSVVGAGASGVYEVDEHVDEWDLLGLRKFAGNCDEDNQALKGLFMDSGHPEISMKTKDGVWIQAVHLPDPSGIPGGAKMTVDVDSTWEVYVNRQGICWKVDQGQEISFEIDNNEWSQTSGPGPLQSCPGEVRNTCVGAPTPVVSSPPVSNAPTPSKSDDDDATTEERVFDNAVATTSSALDEVKDLFRGWGW